MPPLVIKLGGSLADWPQLAPMVRLLAAQTARPILLVPGGGPFADAVRAAQKRQSFDDSAAHRMALLAMDQYGLMLQSLAPQLAVVDDAAGLAQAAARPGTTLWLPSRHITGHPGIPESWDITSDSLAAWAAAEVKASHLLLIKSALPPEIMPPHDAPLAAWAGAGIVDAAFAAFAAKGDFTVSVLPANAWHSLETPELCGIRVGRA